MAAAADIAGGQERFPVACNDSEEFPSNFTYISRAAVQIQLSDAVGCSCAGRCCDAAGCSCAVGDDQDHSEHQGHQRTAQECGSACCCGPDCDWRASQQGLSAPVQLMRGAKGWSAYAANTIPEGTFVACYIGEQLNRREAERRLRQYDLQPEQHQHALLVVREVLPSGACLRLNIDATSIGNVSRFFNHSCDGGNLSAELVRSRGDMLPRVALFAVCDIAAGSELTFSYGAPSAGPAATDFAEPGAPQLRRCLCETAACRGFLPRAGL